MNLLYFFNLVLLVLGSILLIINEFKYSLLLCFLGLLAQGIFILWYLFMPLLFFYISESEAANGVGGLLLFQAIHLVIAAKYLDFRGTICERLGLWCLIVFILNMTLACGIAYILSRFM